MMTIKEKFSKSAAQLSKTQTLTGSAMLLSVSIVLGYYGNVTIGLFGTNTVKLSFAVLPIILTAMLYGPIPAGIVGALNDVICFILMPKGAYIPGFTISMLLTGFIYGAGLYSEKAGVKRVAVTQLIVSLLINELLGSLWFVLFYGFTPGVALATRGIKELIMFPILTVFTFSIEKVVKRLPQIKAKN